MRTKKILLITTIALSSTIVAQPNDNTIKNPTEEKTKIYGSYANGCLADGVAIPFKDTGYEQVRPSRKRNFGSPAMSIFIEELGKFGRANNTTVILGDISQEHGGPLSFGHASHQIGLDVDIWFEKKDRKGLNNHEREKLDTPSLVDAKKGIISSHWNSYYRDLIYAAAQHPQTERIFVNPVIKAHLCEIETDKRWLYKVRPWFGHDSHFHVRLFCPKGQKECIPQAPIPKSDGCNADLNNWIKDQQDYALGIKKHKPSSASKSKKILPYQCKVLLNQF